MSFQGTNYEQHSQAFTSHLLSTCRGSESVFFNVTNGRTEEINLFSQMKQIRLFNEYLVKSRLKGCLSPAIIFRTCIN